MFQSFLRVGQLAAVVVLSVGSASAATLLTAGDFIAPTIVTFNGVAFSGPYEDAVTYTESGATFSTPSPASFYLYLDIMDVNGVDPLEVAFGTPMLRFGFLANAVNPNIGNPSTWDVTQVNFYSDDNFTTLVDSYAILQTLGTAPTFYGLQASAPFRSIQIYQSGVTGGGGFSAYLDDFRFEASAIPEPASAGLLAGGLLAGALTFFRRRS